MRMGRAAALRTLWATVSGRRGPGSPSTGRLLAVGEAFPWGGVTAEVVSRVVAEGFHLLDAPPKRLNARDTPIPYHPNLWAAHRPTAAAIAGALRELLGF